LVGYTAPFVSNQTVTSIGFATTFKNNTSLQFIAKLYTTSTKNKIKPWRSGEEL